MASNSSANNRKTKMSFGIKISPAELSYRSNLYPDESSITTTRLYCTKCDAVIKPRMVSDKNVHPILAVLVCKKCRFFCDQRISENQNSICKWCASDRNLYGCGTCPAKFCEGCINKHIHLARTVFQEIQEKKWKCCVCFPKQIWLKRAVCAAAKNFAENSNKALKDRISKCNTSTKQPSSRISQRDQNSVTSNTTTSFTKAKTKVVAAPLQKQVTHPEEKSADSKISEKATQSEDFKKETDQGTCVICLLDPAIMLLYPCGHKCLCKECSILWSQREKNCPLCRKTFKDIIRLYE